MSDFYSAFEKQRSDYLEHWGIKGMKWGVINQKPTMGYQQQGISGQQPTQPGQQYPINSYTGMTDRQVRRDVSHKIRNARKEVTRKKVRRVVMMLAAVGATQVLKSVVASRKKSKV